MTRDEMIKALKSASESDQICAFGNMTDSNEEVYHMDDLAVMLDFYDLDGLIARLDKDFAVYDDNYFMDSIYDGIYSGEKLDDLIKWETYEDYELEDACKSIGII